MKIHRSIPADRITLRGITFVGPHGWTEQERSNGSSFSVDLTVFTDLSVAGQSDDIVDTVDWRDLAAAVVKIGTGRSFRLVESLAETIAAEVLSLCKAGTCVEVVVEKTSASLDGSPQGATVTIRRCV